MTLALNINGDAIRDTFHAWHEQRESLDSQLTESLDALAAYQSSLDAWQQSLARERDELRKARQQFDRDRETTATSQAESSAAMANELQVAREKITALTTMLLNRTEELRALDNRRAEIQTELEIERVKEKELKIALDDQKLSVEQERSQWAEELRQLREVLVRQLDEPPQVQEPVAADAGQRSEPPIHPPASGATNHASQESPVLGSIVQQFDKLRQQRAVGRQAVKPR